MSEWERVFGVGVSAESVIGRINAQADAEECDMLQKMDQRGFLNSVAYRGDPALKTVFLRELKERSGAGDRLAEERDMASILQSSEDTFLELEDRYRIPRPLSVLINAIFVGMRRETVFIAPTEKHDSNAVEWLIECFSAIEPGVDLRFIIPKFQVGLASTSMSLLRGAFRARKLNRGQPAFEILCARARGIRVQDDLVSAASRVIESQLRPEDIEWPFNYGLHGEDLALTVLLFLLKEQTDMAAAAGAIWKIYNRGDAEERTFWTEFGAELVTIIKTAPTTRLKIVDFEKVEKTLRAIEGV